MSNRKPTKANRSPRSTPNVGFSGDLVTSAAAMMLSTVQPRRPVAPRAKRVGALSSPAPTAAARFDERVLQASAVTCAPFEPLQPQSVGISYWFDTRPEGPAYDVPVRLVGTLVQSAELDDATGDCLNNGV